MAILKPAPEFGEFLDRLEPLGRVRRHCPFAVEQHVGVGPVLLPADAAAQLVQVRQAIVVRLVDEDGVGVGNVQAAFDDRRRDQDVRLLAHECRASLAPVRARPSGRGR